MAAGDTLVETSPYSIAVVMFAFLVFAVSFEKGIHHLKHYLEHHKKKGLLSALNNMIIELALLGFAALFFMAFEDNISKICVKATVGKSWISKVDACACCLPRTKGLSSCMFKEPLISARKDDGPLAKTCAFSNKKQYQCQCGDYNKDTGVLGYSGNSWAGNSSKCLSIVDDGGKYRRRTLLGEEEIWEAVPYAGEDKAAAKDIVCKQGVQQTWPECKNKPGYHPAVSVNALHQIDLFIFMITICHIILGGLLILVSKLRVRVWKRWRQSDNLEALLAKESQWMSNGMPPPGAGTALGLGALDSLRSSQSAEDMLTEKCAQMPVLTGRRWGGRPLHIENVFQRMGEIVVLFWRQVAPNPISRAEFLIARVCFTFTHPVGDNDFNFMGFLSESLEEDFADVVGLGLEQWIFIILFVLISAEAGWTVWLFTLFAAIAMLVLNIKLVSIIRHVTRGGRIHRLEPHIFWFNRPRLFLPIIKLLLFFMSFVYSNAMFFGAQFGGDSCFFSRTGFQWMTGIPWWLVMIINTVLFAWLALVTLPVYTLAVQMGPSSKQTDLIVQFLKVKPTHQVELTDRHHAHDLLDSAVRKPRQDV